MAALLASDNKKPINKWLIALMLVTVVLTAKTAFNDYANKQDDLTTDVEAKPNKPSQKGMLQKSAKSQTQSNQEIVKTDANNPPGFVASSAIPWQQLTRNQPSIKPYNIFKVHSWVVVPPVVKQKPQPVPAPVAPQVPFTYMGKLEDPIKGTQVFLTLNGRLYSVFKGENINQQWRIDTEDANNIHLTFLPLNSSQILSKEAKPVMPIVPADPAIADAST